MKKYLDFALDRILENSQRYGNLLPLYSVDKFGKYVLQTGGGWTDSFWVGMLNISYSIRNDAKYLDAATKYQDFFRERAKNDLEYCKENKIIPLDHDTGFVFSLSQVARYMLMGDEEAKSMAISAAYTLAGRFNEKGKFIRAWDDWANDTPEFREEKKGKFIIDSMMNMPLLMWAGKETGDTRLIDIANQHSMTVRKYIVREDFSTYHTYNMNYTTGEPINGCTKQGYSDESCWSRGQAWAIYGFALMYSFTKNEEYLNASIKLAEYFIKKLTIFNLPYWDFGVEDLLFKPWDSSAACIAVCGMLEIAGLVKDEVPKKYFHDWSRKILDSVNHYCSTKLTEESEALLLHGCAGPVYYIENPSKVFGNSDVPLIFGDYFYVEALARVCLGDKFIRFW